MRHKIAGLGKEISWDLCSECDGHLWGPNLATTARRGRLTENPFLGSDSHHLGGQLRAMGPRQSLSHLRLTTAATWEDRGLCGLGGMGWCEEWAGGFSTWSPPLAQQEGPETGWEYGPDAADSEGKGWSLNSTQRGGDSCRQKPCLGAIGSQP